MTHYPPHDLVYKLKFPISYISSHLATNNIYHSLPKGIPNYYTLHYPLSTLANCIPRENEIIEAITSLEPSQ